jgi:hypothetical protein
VAITKLGNVVLTVDRLAAAAPSGSATVMSINYSGLSLGNAPGTSLEGWRSV